jgi:UDP-N-acetylmuramoyl-L-alanyl-D-glutamate--2,6-diaminopimelate ligase
MPEDEVLKMISELKPVRGRFEYLTSSEGIIAIVDYAHTPDALLNVLKTIQKLVADKRKIITVVGAGGNRDKTKRPEMAAIAVEYSHQVILTSDNPRYEEPAVIIKDMEEGIPADKKQMVLSITDRYEAIKTACRLATGGDILLVAGKGHEDYQEVKGVRHHFDDKEVLTEILNTN